MRIPLAYHTVSSSDTICNAPSPPLADIVLFGLSLSSFPSRFFKIFKTRLIGRGFHTLYKECFVLLSNQCRILQSESPFFMYYRAGLTYELGRRLGCWTRLRDGCRLLRTCLLRVLVWACNLWRLRFRVSNLLVWVCNQPRLRFKNQLRFSNLSLGSKPKFYQYSFFPQFPFLLALFSASFCPTLIDYWPLLTTSLYQVFVDQQIILVFIV